MREQGSEQNVDELAATVVDLPPGGWPETLRRVAAIRRYRALAKPRAADACRAAADLGIGERAFYRLVRAFEEHGRPHEITSVRGAKRATDPQVDRHIAQVSAEMGPAASHAAILREVTLRCERDGLTPPTASKLTTRLDDPPARPEPGQTLLTDADAALDVACLPLPVTLDGRTLPFVFLGAFIDVGTGIVRAHHLAATPFGDVDLETLLASLAPRPGPVELVKTDGLGPITPPIEAMLLAAGMNLTDAARPIAAGGALRATFGRHIGRIRILERIPGPSRSAPDGVPLEFARAAIRELVRHRNAEIAR